MQAHRGSRGAGMKQRGKEVRAILGVGILPKTLRRLGAAGRRREPTLTATLAHAPAQVASAAHATSSAAPVLDAPRVAPDVPRAWKSSSTDRLSTFGASTNFVSS